jgi:ArsR family transcriptional regulator, arsenate/arsenite/antimonite-responsive transcriptional repressor
MSVDFVVSAGYIPICEYVDLSIRCPGWIGSVAMHDLDLRRKADLLRILAHPTRLAILEELAPKAKCVTDIRDLLGVSQPNVSQHLTALRRERIVDYHEDGKLRCYYITRPKLVKALLRLLSGDYPIVTRPARTIRREGKRRETEPVDLEKRAARAV